jgi:hypothetical protein
VEKEVFITFIDPAPWIVTIEFRELKFRKRCVCFVNKINGSENSQAKYHLRINERKKSLTSVSCSLLLSSFLKLLHSEITMLKTINSVERKIRGAQQ